MIDNRAITYHIDCFFAGLPKKSWWIPAIISRVSDTKHLTK